MNESAMILMRSKTDLEPA